MKNKSNHSDYMAGGTQRQNYRATDVVGARCPFCAGQRRKKLAQERGAIGVVQCRACNFIYTHPRQRNPEKVYWGSARKYFHEVRLIYEGRARHHRHPNYRQTLDILARFHRLPGRKLLEVGPGLGVQLDLARKAGWDVYGLEPSPSFCRIVRKNLHLRIFQGFLSEAPDSWKSTFDVVIMTDVLEHLANPEVELGRVLVLLKEGGLILIKVPNAGFNLLKMRLGATGAAPSTHRKKLFYDIWDAYEHLVHYTHATLELMLSKVGFQILLIGLGRPVQTPVWHEKTGFYFQYPSPWYWDWKRRLGRSVAHVIGLIEYLLSGRRVGYFGSTLLAVASKPKAFKHVKAG